MTEQTNLNAASSAMATYMTNKLIFDQDTKFDLYDLHIMGGAFYMAEALAKDELEVDQYFAKGKAVRETAINAVIIDSGMDPDEWAIKHLDEFEEWIGEHADA